MAGADLVLAAAIGAVCLAISATLWALHLRRVTDARLSELTHRLGLAQGLADAALASAEAFDCAMITLQDGQARLASGEDSLAACARVLGLTEPAEQFDPMAVIQALMRADPEQAGRLKALFARGEPCAFEARGPGGLVSVEGRTAGALAWLRLAALTRGDADLPTAARFAAFLDSQSGPAWITGAGGSLAWANRAWLTAADATSVADAAARGLAFDRGTDALINEAAQMDQPRAALRWVPVGGQRRAFQITAQPLDGGEVAALALDVTEAEEMREALKRHVEAHDETLNHLADAVAIFSPDKKLAFHNTAFAELWGLEPAWLADRPTHGEVLDRLRQRRRLPETIDYSRWKAEELRHYEALGAAPDEMWTLPDGRTLRVVRQPHPHGGLLILYSDMTGELRLRAQYNALIQVQQATLDKLSDAVAVFGSDGRLRLHNEAFETFWNVSGTDLTSAVDFDGVVELCVPKLHDLQFWRDMKARVADPDPQARVAFSGETKSSDGRIMAYQSRPLPDGATLIAFADVTDTRQLERALADRSAALTEAERLKRDFVGNVSYELRTPLTTIIGYSEVLESGAAALPERARGYVVSVLAAANQLARSIDNVLDMAQMDAGEMALDLGDVHIDLHLEEARERWREEAQAGGLKIVVDCPADIGLIRADSRRLNQTIDHLMENAVRQTPAGGLITLSAVRTFGEVQIQVADTGRGIPFHVQAHIFDRFIGRDRGGPGLGLALVKALVELHGGWVALESEPGQGSRFTCHLPESAHVSTGQAELQF
jgi:signal transduction histidine kinase